MKKHLLLAATFLVLFTACKKEETADPTPSSPAAGNPNTALYYGDADGVLVGTRSVTTTETPIGPLDVIVGLASAFFPSATGGFGSLVNAGEVTADNTPLSFTSGVYTGGVSATNPQGISWTLSTPWTVAGGGGVPAISTTMGDFPSTNWSITSNAPSSTAAYTLTWGSVTGADSITCMVAGGSEAIIKVVPGNSTSCQFSAAEMGRAGKGPGLIQINPYKVSSIAVSGKKIYRVRQIAKSKTVTIN